MRYKSWDVLLFPQSSKIPQQEFKTSCHVIPDLETENLQPNPSLLPTITCFVPSLEAGDNFRVSIHSWENPEISLHTLGLRRPSDKVSFEARLFIDGIESGSKQFVKNGPWPTVIETIMDERGQFESLKFPVFHQELLSQSYWSPIDNLGRIRVTISEGLIREDNGYQFERVRNIISFSFQHAPLHLLEGSSIAWPNALMWQQATHVGLQYSRACSPQHSENFSGNGSQSPPYLLTDAKIPDYTKQMLTPKASRQGSNLHNDPLTQPTSTIFKNWHEGTVDLYTLDYLQSDSLKNSISQPRAEFLSSEESSLESICESMFAAPAANDITRNEEDLNTEDDIIAPNKIMLPDFEDQELSMEESFYPTLDSDMFDVPKAEKIGLSEYIAGPGLNFTCSESLSSKGVQSISLTLPNSNETIASDTSSNPG